MDQAKNDKVEETAKEPTKVKEKAEEPVEVESKAEVKAEEVKEGAKETAQKVEEPKVEPVPVKEEKPAPSGKYKEIIEKIENLSVLELAELVKDLEDRFGVSAAAPMMAMPAQSAAAGGAPAEEEKALYDLVLASGGDKKIQVIKVVREIKPDLGLKEAKDLVDGALKELAKGMKKEEAEEAKKKLETAGATVELK